MTKGDAPQVDEFGDLRGTTSSHPQPARYPFEAMHLGNGNWASRYGTRAA